MSVERWVSRDARQEDAEVLGYVWRGCQIPNEVHRCALGTPPIESLVALL
jgi:hypothetical protein